MPLTLLIRSALAVFLTVHEAKFNSFLLYPSFS